VDVVEGENAWIGIVTKKKYTNLTSCTAVRSSLAVDVIFAQLNHATKVLIHLLFFTLSLFSSFSSTV